MRYKYNPVLIIMFLTGLTLLASCDRGYKAGFVGPHKKDTIALSVNTDTKMLVVDTNPIGKCEAAHRKNGCVVVARKETATISFKLRASSGWHLTEFQICAGDSKSGNCSLEKWQESEFSVFLRTGSTRQFPDSKGIVKLQSLSSNPVKKFKLFDYNSTEQDYFYTIKACKGTGDSLICYSTDPLIRNKGRR